VKLTRSVLFKACGDGPCGCVSHLQVGCFINFVLLGLLGYCTPLHILWALRFIDDVFGILLNI